MRPNRRLKPPRLTKTNATSRVSPLCLPRPEPAKTPKPKETPAGRWVSYRPEIKVLDCTIRDGGLMNNHKFDDQVVKAVYDACVGRRH